ncbi:MAG: FKBP-type peptidyl-prolyl cis-trans isomerase [Gemmatimonadota bacterium]|nr:FKBP-type peptidyl-prolyl cis-trans isomerase [Gemmatimonadota bacterium]MDE2677933.1 FKBP-type peptidyl-prolyl cis-trans isomerase [Gemmatimonadota bacterium]MXX36435.1 FKBP-type peptidyl-prolyl cis-trans isomerase [Gemmatimonadota bacterium]MYD13588.1 FKBP-type peptidyl-prolyl cis-trans isomerase [Gemmatimonadota bacterium]
MFACLRARTATPLPALTALPLLAALAACSSDAPGGDVPLDTDVRRASYAIGQDLAGYVAGIEDKVDRPALFRGFSDALADVSPALTEMEMRDAVIAFNEMLAAAQAEEAAGARAAGEAFLADNAEKDGVMTTESGLQYEVLREGDGESPEEGQRVEVHYRGTLINGIEFDSSYGGDPATFSLDGVIPGFAEAIMLMRVGGHLRAFLPSGLGYGDSGSGSIGPGEALIFEIELLGIG